MNENTTEKRKTAWGALCLGVLMAVVGAIMIAQGITAYKTGAIIPATTKLGPMTGSQSILTGIITTVAGLFFVGNEIFRTLKKLKYVYDVGKHKVIVKKKNKTWGVVNSLDLYLHDGQLLTFYCTTGKVAAMLLNDFVIDQKAELEIKTSDGLQCELLGNNAYAYGIISLKSEK